MKKVPNDGLGCVAIVLAATVIAAVILMAIAVEAWIIMSLWNWGMVSAFGAPELTFWHALALSILFSMVLGSLRRPEK